MSTRKIDTLAKALKLINKLTIQLTYMQEALARTEEQLASYRKEHP